MANQADFKVKKGLLVQGGDLNFSNAQNAVIQVDTVSGTNVTGKNLTISGGESTGNAAGGSILLQTAAAGSTGPSSNSVATRVTIDGTGKTTITNLEATTADINAGTIDGTDITVGSGKTLNVSSGTLTTSAAQKLAIVEGIGANADIGAYILSAKSFKATTTSGNLLELKYDNDNYITHAMSSDGVYTMAVTDESSDSGKIVFSAALGAKVENGDLLVASKSGTAYRKITIGDSGLSATDADRAYMLATSETSYRTALNTAPTTSIMELGNGATNAASSSGAVPSQAQFTAAKTGLAIGSSGEVYRIGDTNPSTNQYLKWNGTKWVPAGLTSGAVTALNNATENELVTIGSTTTELDAESTLTFDGTDGLISAAGKWQFRDAAIFINSSADGKMDIDADGEIEMNTATLDVDASTAVTITTPTLTLDDSSSANKLTLKNTNIDANGASLIIEKGGNSAADEDVIGNIEFKGQDSLNNSQVYGKIYTESSDVTSGAEQGKMTLQVAENDGTLTAGLILAGSTTDGEVDVTIGAGSDSLTIIRGDLQVEGDTTTVQSSTMTVSDLNIVLAQGAANAAAANGAGITIDGASATLTYANTTGDFDVSENMDLASGKTYKIAGTDVLSATTLGSAVVTSSLTSVGTIGTGRWEGDAIDDTYVADALTINGGTIDNTPIGNITKSTGKFTSVGVDDVILIDTGSGTLTTTSASDIYTFAAGTYSAAKFIVSVWKDDTDDYRQVTEILLTYDGASSPAASSNIHLTEYAVVEGAGGSLGTFDAVKSSGNIKLQFTPGSTTSTKYRVHATLLAI